MPPVFKRQKRATLMDQALNEIRKAIRSGKLKPGERLVESQLAEAMQISRFPIREALRYLEKEGLVETKPFMGTHVAQLSEKDMEELYSLRSAIEELAVRILIENIDPAKINALETIFHSMQKASQDEKLEKMIVRRFTVSSDHLRAVRPSQVTDGMVDAGKSIAIIYEYRKGSVRNRFSIRCNPPSNFGGNQKPQPKACRKKIREHLNLSMRVVRQGYWEKTLNPKQIKGKK